MSITFYRDQLKTKQARDFYDEICSSICRGNVGGIFPLTYKTRSTATKDCFDAIKALRNDRPDFFFIGNVSEAILRKNRLVLMNQVPYTPDQIAKIRLYLEKELAAFTANTAGLSEWDREKVIYERIIRKLTYIDHGDGKNAKEYDHNVVGPLLQGSGVCEGFSCLLMLALRRAGIPCIRVSGYGKNEAHCWNMAWIEGSPVHLDITWDSVNDNGDVGFFYFNLTDEQITRDHKITTKGLPECIDPTHGYHFRKGTVFSSAGDASKFFKAAFLNNRGPYAVRFSLDGDINSIIKKAMRNAPVLSYSYRYSDTQRTALVWGG